MMLWRLLAVPLLLYFVGLFAFCNFLSPADWVVGISFLFISLVSPSVAIGLYFATIPLQILLLDNPPFYFSGPSFCLALLLLGALLRLIFRRTKVHAGGAYLLFLASLVVLGLGPLARFWELLVWYPADMPTLLWRQLYTGDQLNSLTFIGETFTYFLGILLFLVIRVQLSSPRESVPRLGGPRERVEMREAVYWGLVSGAAVLAALSLYDLIERGRSPVHYFLVFGDRNSYAAFCIVTLALLSGLWGTRKTWVRILVHLVYLIFLLLLLATLSLTGLISWVVITTLGLAAFRREAVKGWLRFDYYRRRWTSILLILLSCYFILPLLARFFPSTDPIMYAEEVGLRLRSVSPAAISDTLSETRLYLWATGWEMFKGEPLFGHGLGRYYAVSGNYLQSDRILRLAGRQTEYAYENAHNYFLQLAAEGGLLGILVFGSFLAWLLWRPAKSGRAKEHAAWIAVVGLLTMSLMGHPLLVEGIYFVFCALAALVAGPTGRPVEAKHSYLKSVSARLAACACGTILVILFCRHLAATRGELPSNFETGFYSTEGGNGRSFRWTQGLALKRISGGALETLEMAAGNPDLTRWPLGVELFVDGSEVAKFELKDREWKTIQNDWPPGRAYVLGIRTSRTWRPVDFGSPDYRQLGLMSRLSPLQQNSSSR